MQARFCRFDTASAATSRRPSHRLHGHRSGRTNALVAMFCGGLAIVVALGLLMKLGGPGDAPRGKTLTMFCAAGIRVPVAEIAEDYERRFGVHVDLQYGGSDTLLNQLKINKQGDADIYLAADDFYTDQARREGLAAETFSIAWQRPMIVVPRDNPKNIQSVRDLLRDDVRVVLGNPDQAAVGRAVRKRLSKFPADKAASNNAAGTDRSGDAPTLWSELESAVTSRGVFKPTVNDVATDVRIGLVDAGIVWDSTAMLPAYREDLVAVPVPELDGDPDLVSVCVLNSSKQPAAALRFCRWLTSSDQGLTVFEKYGSDTVDGDVWAERPEITFFCGAINRNAIAPVIEAFEDREGVTVRPVYDGCGILTGRMKTIVDQQTDQGFPDVYMACDRYYLDNVKDWFQDDVDVSDAEIVIVVPRGSDKVRSLQDLVKPGIRVSIGQPDQCTIGVLTRRLLDSQGLYEPLIARQMQDGEVVVEKPSSALLVPDVVTGHVDATIAYITDTVAVADQVDIIHIESTLNRAVQPFSISRSSRFKHLGRRLLDRISAARPEFEAAGFHFRLDPPGVGPPPGN